MKQRLRPLRCFCAQVLTRSPFRPQDAPVALGTTAQKNLFGGCKSRLFVDKRPTNLTLTRQTVFIAIESLGGRADKALLGFASRREARLRARVDRLGRELEMFRDDLVGRAKASSCASGQPCTCAGDRALLDCAMKNAERRLTSLAVRVAPGTRAELNAIRLIRATLERAICDFTAATTCDEIAEAVVNAVDDVQDYLLAHDLVIPAPIAIGNRRGSAGPAGRVRPAISRSAVHAWARVQEVADGEPELAICGSRLAVTGSHLPGNGLKLA